MNQPDLSIPPNKLCEDFNVHDPGKGRERGREKRLKKIHTHKIDTHIHTYI